MLSLNDLTLKIEYYLDDIILELEEKRAAIAARKAEREAKKQALVEAKAERKRRLAMQKRMSNSLLKARASVLVLPKDPLMDTRWVCYPTKFHEKL